MCVYRYQLFRAPAVRKSSRVLDSSFCDCGLIFSVCSYFISTFFSIISQGNSEKRRIRTVNSQWYERCSVMVSSRYLGECKERKSNIVVYFIYFIHSLSLIKKYRNPTEIFVLVRLKFLRYRLLFQFIYRNGHLLVCCWIITVISVQL